MRAPTRTGIYIVIGKRQACVVPRVHDGRYDGGIAASHGGE